MLVFVFVERHMVEKHLDGVVEDHKPLVRVQLGLCLLRQLSLDQQHLDFVLVVWLLMLVKLLIPAERNFILETKLPGQSLFEHQELAADLVEYFYSVDVTVWRKILVQVFLASDIDIQDNLVVSNGKL